MSFSVVGWSELQDTAGVLTEVLALPDQHVTTDGDDVSVPDFAAELGMVACMGVTITQAQFSSPTLRKSLLVDVCPINIADVPTSPPGFMDFHDARVKLTAAEGLRALVAEGAVAAELETCFAWLFGPDTPAPAGEPFWVRLDGATALVPDLWTLVPLALSQQLNAGRYAIVGMRAQSATGRAARLVIPGLQFRPGCLVTIADGDIEAHAFDTKVLGNWGEFNHTYPPQAEFQAAAADAAEVVWLALVKIA